MSTIYEMRLAMDDLGWTSSYGRERETPPPHPADADDADVKYRDRPADEGMHGDGDQEPNTGTPNEAEPC